MNILSLKILELRDQLAEARADRCHLYDRLDGETQKRVKLEDTVAWLVLALMLVTGSAQAQEASPLVRGAVSTLYVAGDRAQEAVDLAVCSDSQFALSQLQGEDRRQARHIEDAVRAAIRDGGDRAKAEFCAWAGER